MDFFEIWQIFYIIGMNITWDTLHALAQSVAPCCFTHNKLPLKSKRNAMQKIKGTF